MKATYTIIVEDEDREDFEEVCNAIEHLEKEWYFREFKKQFGKKKQVFKSFIDYTNKLFQGGHK